MVRKTSPRKGIRRETKQIRKRFLCDVQRSGTGCHERKYKQLLPVMRGEKSEAIRTSCRLGKSLCCSVTTRPLFREKSGQVMRFFFSSPHHHGLNCGGVFFSTNHLELLCHTKPAHNNPSRNSNGTTKDRSPKPQPPGQREGGSYYLAPSSALPQRAWKERCDPLPPASRCFAPGVYIPL